MLGSSTINSAHIPFMFMAILQPTTPQHCEGSITWPRLSLRPKILVSQDLAQGALIEVLPTYVAKSLGIYAVYPYSKQPRKVKLFIEHLYYYYQRHQDQFK